jgi:hypothetical protein
LRIGEAKLDYSERLAKEREKALENEGNSKKKKRRLPRGVQGVHASDMSLVTKLKLRPGWRTTPLGRLIRPMRMRPFRPLGKPPASSRPERKKTTKAQLVRTRRRKLDPEEWGSQYLSGIMLETGRGAILPERHERVVSDDETFRDIPLSVGAPASSIVSIPSSPSPSPSPSLRLKADNHEDEEEEALLVPETSTKVARGGDGNIVQEAARSMALLNSLFGNNADECDWGGTESLSDVEMLEGETKLTTSPDNDVTEIEYVPREKKGTVSRRDLDEPSSPSSTPSAPTAEEEEAAKRTVEEAVLPTVTNKTTLKDMFAPRSEDGLWFDHSDRFSITEKFLSAGFSLLGALDIDLELELEEDLHISAPLPFHSERGQPDVPASILSYLDT